MEFYGNYRKIDKLGAGTYSVVYRARKQGSKVEYALKALRQTEYDDKEKERIKREVDILKILDHVNIVKMHESFYENNDKILCIVMDFCEGGTLRQLVDRRGPGRPLPEREFLYYLLQIAEGLKYLHYNDIIHRDIKTKNILLTVEKVIKIGDFGTASCRYLDSTSADQMSLYVGTPYYMSPEMIDGADYDEKTDIWSMGCCAYEMSASRRVFEDVETLRRLQAEIRSFKVPDQLPEIQYCWEVKQLIIRMLQQKVQSRPKASQVVTYIKELLASTEHRCVLQQQAAQKESEHQQPEHLDQGNNHQQNENLNQDRKSRQSQLEQSHPQLQRDSGNETDQSGLTEVNDDDDDDSTLRNHDIDNRLQNSEEDTDSTIQSGPQSLGIHDDSQFPRGSGGKPSTQTNPIHLSKGLEDEEYINHIKDVALNTKEGNLADDDFLAQLHELAFLPSTILDLFHEEIITIRWCTLTAPENEDNSSQ